MSINWPVALVIPQICNMQSTSSRTGEWRRSCIGLARSRSTCFQHRGSILHRLGGTWYTSSFDAILCFVDQRSSRLSLVWKVLQSPGHALDSDTSYVASPTRSSFLASLIILHGSELSEVCELTLNRNSPRHSPRMDFWAAQNITKAETNSPQRPAKSKDKEYRFTSPPYPHIISTRHSYLLRLCFSRFYKKRISQTQHLPDGPVAEGLGPRYRYAEGEGYYRGLALFRSVAPDRWPSLPSVRLWVSRPHLRFRFRFRVVAAVYFKVRYEHPGVKRASGRTDSRFTW